MAAGYAPELLWKMREGCVRQLYDGVPVTVIPIPDGADEGDLDPRVYSGMRLLPLLRLLPFETRRAKTLLETVKPYRKAFNSYKGAYTSEHGVITDYAYALSADGYRAPLRAYRPAGGCSGAPVLVYFHGGSFMGGGTHIPDQFIKSVVRGCGCVAVSCEYRLCPENRFPAPMLDALAAVRWARDNAELYGGDSRRIVAAGDDAGGSLAAAVTLWSHTQGADLIKAQALLYPITNIAELHTGYFHGADISKFSFSAKHEKLLRSMLSSTESVRLPELRAQVYLQGDTAPDHPFVSPAFGSAEGLPPTVLVCAEYDRLIFDNIAYAKKLAGSFVNLEVLLYRGMGHGFADRIGVYPQADDCAFRVAEFIKANT